MITEEETEKIKADLKQLYSLLLLRPSISTNAIENALQYIEQLETEKQNLIEKLEREGQNNKERYSSVSEDLRLYVRGKIDCINEILSYMEGEEK